VQKTTGKNLSSDTRLQTLDSRLQRHGGNIYAFARSRGLSPDQVLDFSASINPLGWPRGVAKAYRQALTRIVHYPEPYAETLTKALAASHDLDPHSILVGNGSTQLIYLLARVLAPQRALIVAPSFSEHAATLQRSGAQINHVILRPPSFALSLERLQKTLTQGCDVLVLTNPNSPTGTLLPRAELEQVVRMCHHPHTRLVVDEAFVDWVEEASLKHQAEYSPHVVVLRSLTKFFALPGLRVGYLVAQPRLIARLRAQMEPWSVNAIAQEVARVCLQDAAFPQRSRAFMERERTWLSAQLRTIEGLRPFPSHANFLLVKVTQPGVFAAEVVRRLAEDNLLVRDCGNFVGLGKRFFRVAVRTRSENRRLLAALQASV
jgi:threonine-phosphate decarboxylase